ncbi:MAG: O-antigen ligase family protein [Sarcina sp.]
MQRDKRIARIFYLSILLWPLIFVINEIIKIPNVFLSLIYALIGLAYIYNLNIKKFKVLFAGFLIIGFSQVFILVTSLNFSTTLEGVSNMAKFCIRWSHFIIYFNVLAEGRVLRTIDGYMHKNIKLMLRVTKITLAIIIISFPFAFAYEKVWEGKYFKSIFYSPHVNSYFLLGIMSIFIYGYLKNKDKKINLLLAIISSGLNMLTGARTTGILSLGVLGLLILYVVSKNLKILKYGLITLVIFLAGNIIFKVIDFSQIPLFEKFMNVLNDPSGFLNGRNYIWMNMFNYTKDYSNLLNYIFGVGFAQSININFMYIQQGLWSHNDLVETFVGGGIIGLYMYINALKVYIVKSKEYIFSFIIIFIMFFNGLFLYTELLVFIPIITLCGKNIIDGIIFNFKELAK